MKKRVKLYYIQVLVLFKDNNKDNLQSIKFFQCCFPNGEEWYSPYFQFIFEISSESSCSQSVRSNSSKVNKLRPKPQAAAKKGLNGDIPCNQLPVYDQIHPAEPSSIHRSSRNGFNRSISNWRCRTPRNHPTIRMYFRPTGRHCRISNRASSRGGIFRVGRFSISPLRSGILQYRGV